MPVTVKHQSSLAITYPLVFTTPHCPSDNSLNPLVCHYQSNASLDRTDISPTYALPFDSLSDRRMQAGFTLVEIVVVVVILSIFAGMMSLSVGSSESRKNRAFYEHFTDALGYVRLLSAERMQPMGLSLQADKQGQIAPVIVTLSNPYMAYQTTLTATDRTDKAKNSMELSADVMGMSNAADASQPTPSWESESEVSLPELPAGVSMRVQSLSSADLLSAKPSQALQPWFSNQTVPQVVWFGTGQATPVTIEIIHDARLVGEVITIMPDGGMILGQGK